MAPLLVVAAVLATIGGAVALRPDHHAAARGCCGASTPPLPVLRLAGVQLGDVEAPLDRVHGLAGGYRLAGALSSAAPPDAPTYRLRQPSDAEVRRLTAALGLPGAAHRVTGGWRLDVGARRLSVANATGSWTFGLRGCVSDPMSDTSVACPLPFHRPPSAAQVKAWATATLSALGLDHTMTITGGTVTAQPRVGRVETSGTGVSLAYSPDGLETASGQLGATRTLGRYPLVSAREAYEQLAAQPRAMMELCRVSADSMGCLPLDVQTVTGARLGLAPYGSVGGTVLAPTWLFTVRGHLDPVLQIAVQRRYLRALPALAGGGLQARQGGAVSTPAQGSPVPAARGGAVPLRNRGGAEPGCRTGQACAQLRTS